MPVSSLPVTTTVRSQWGKQQGYTLLEMLIVAAIIVLVATLALPSLSTDDADSLDAATSEVVAAVRFAHSEAIRTGVPHGVYATQISQRIRIYSLPVPGTPIYDVYDPLTKQLYDLNYSTGTSDVAISSVYFKFKDFWLPQSYLGFSGGTGIPKYNDSGTIRMLETAYIRLSHNGVQRTISISPMTGRVTVQ
ncbi:MAG: prepilin-type N-terminal cleavage/methylation domain-containing protein [Gammaproteobacteria bacterium]|nr:prepilin-type N-terminal cleavage/methylation domain-containing protein [Gammaproteobacteria bacterium]